MSVDPTVKNFSTRAIAAKALSEARDFKDTANIMLETLATEINELKNRIKNIENSLVIIENSLVP